MPIDNTPQYLRNFCKNLVNTTAMYVLSSLYSPATDHELKTYTFVENQDPIQALLEIENIVARKYFIRVEIDRLPKQGLMLENEIFEIMTYHGYAFWGAVENDLEFVLGEAPPGAPGIVKDPKTTTTNNGGGGGGCFLKRYVNKPL